MIDTLLRRSPLQPLSRLRHRRRVAVLAYHGIPDRTAFGRQLDIVTDVLQPIGLAQYLMGDIPERAALVTFDDGDPTVITNALPELVQRDMPAVCFVVPGLVDSSEAFWWDEVTAHLGADGPVEVRRMKRLPDAARRDALRGLREAHGPLTAAQLTTRDLETLVEGGVEIGNHSMTHPCLDQCDDETVRAEVHGAHGALASMTGTAPQVFAYPNGNWDRRVEAELVHLGYPAAFLFDHRHDDPSDGHPLRRSRLRMNPAADVDRCRIILSGLHPAIHRVRGRS